MIAWCMLTLCVCSDALCPFVFLVQSPRPVGMSGALSVASSAQGSDDSTHIKERSTSMGQGTFVRNATTSCGARSLPPRFRLFPPMSELLLLPTRSVAEPQIQVIRRTQTRQQQQEQQHRHIYKEDYCVVPSRLILLRLVHQRKLNPNGMCLHCYCNCLLIRSVP